MSDFDLAFESFKHSIFQLQSYQSFINTIERQRHSHIKQLEDLGEVKKVYETNAEDWTKHQSFIYKNYNNGELNLFGHEDFNRDDFFTFDLELKNRQYQFILLHAFEAFETYLKEAAIAMGYLKIFKPTKFIQYVHKHIPTIKQIIEIRNQHDQFLDEINLLLTFSIIEQLRHQITHSSGYAKNKALFIKKCLGRIGRYSDGKPKSEYIEIINLYFGKGKRENEVCLLEIRDKTTMNSSYDRLDYLIRELLSYIIFVHPHIKNSVQQQAPDIKPSNTI